MKRSTLFVSAKAPGKLIISGEHAVVYGAPAITIAINHYVTTTIRLEQRSNLLNLDDPKINFDLFDLKYSNCLGLNALRKLKLELENNYDNFLQGSCKIKEVFRDPWELLLYLVINLIERLQLPVKSNLNIQLSSNLPAGAGLGSSAAVIISCFKAILYLYKINLDLEKILLLAKDVENLQHGRSSGIDLYTTFYGGCNYFSNEKQDPMYTRNKLNFSEFSLNMINTGKPAATTGECVVAVSKYFLHTQSLVKDFTAITKSIKQALTERKQQDFIDAIKDNHKLLCKLGVVPEKIMDLIKQIEKAGGAGKICGAGSIYGDQAGAVMLLGETEILSRIVNKYKYLLQEVRLDHTGVSIV